MYACMHVCMYAAVPAFRRDWDGHMFRTDLRILPVQCMHVCLYVCMHVGKQVGT